LRKEVALLNRAVAIVLLVQLALLACFAGKILGFADGG
jgi:hypothetical protein